MKRRILLLFTLLVSTLAFAQTRIITGKITDVADGSGLPGVNIVVQGTTRGITSDIEGAYSIELAQGEDKLVFSFIGYKTQTIEVGQMTIINVSMETDSKQLEEVVVVGYGQQKKSDIT